jgi:hypothetical protein
LTRVLALAPAAKNRVRRSEEGNIFAVLLERIGLIPT